VPYREGHRDETAHRREQEQRGDVESGGGSGSKRPAFNAVEVSDYAAGSFESIVPTDTPFFHLDLAGAVRAAEAGLKRDRASTSSAASSLKGFSRDEKPASDPTSA
jgi:solute carrier family 26 (sodium-independent sulfate anion transporter), member 11